MTSRYCVYDVTRLFRGLGDRGEMEGREKANIGRKEGEARALWVCHVSPFRKPRAESIKILFTDIK